MRLLPAIAITIGLSLPASAQEATVERIDVVSKGTYEITTGEVTPDPDAPTGATAAPVLFNLVEATSSVSARIGLEFGLEYRVVGSPEGAEVTLDLVNIYPASGLAEPGRDAPLRESRYQRTKQIGEVTYIGYGFEEDWEMVPGTWTFQIWHEDQKLLDESLTIEK